MDLDPHTEAQLRALCDARNRAICEILDDASGALHVDELADRLVARDVTLVSSSVYEDELDDARLDLHHRRLPKLADVGLVEYDREANRVTAATSPVADVEWQDGPSLEGLVDILGTEPGGEDGEVGLVEGRDAVIEYGQKVAEEAKAELFTIYASTHLVEEKCIEYGRQALDRDVTLCVGSQNPTVRNFCREELPRATVWEPQLDWLEAPAYPRVGRLLLGDRQQVMLSVLQEAPTDGEFPKENALVGNGEGNPLVVLVRELLGPRLDHLDHQSEDFRSTPSPY